METLKGNWNSQARRFRSLPFQSPGAMSTPSPLHSIHSPGPTHPSCIYSRRKVLNKLNFSVPDDVMRKIAQCSPGVVELVLIPLRQRLEERQRRQKLGAGSLQVLLLEPADGGARGAPPTHSGLGDGDA